jgi:hypothetical protein
MVTRGEGVVDLKILDPAYLPGRQPSPPGPLGLGSRAKLDLTCYNKVSEPPRCCEHPGA